MEKLVYILWKPAGDGAADFRKRALDALAPRCLAAGARGLACNLVDEHVEGALSARITHLDPPPAGTLSVWLDEADARGPVEAALAEACARFHGYLVVESVPLRNTTHTAALGERTPGINMVALIERPERLPMADWIAHWHGHHRVVALETQCTYLYVRNVVVRALTPDAPPWAGIVEEGFPAEAVTNPMLWYRAGGSKETFERNLQRMIESCKAFLDLDRVESHPMTEYRLLEQGSSWTG